MTSSSHNQTDQPLHMLVCQHPSCYQDELCASIRPLVPSLLQQLSSLLSCIIILSLSTRLFLQTSSVIVSVLNKNKPSLVPTPTSCPYQLKHIIFWHLEPNHWFPTCQPMVSSLRFSPKLLLVLSAAFGTIDGFLLGTLVGSAFLIYLELDHFSPLSLPFVMTCLDSHNSLLTGLPASSVLSLYSISHQFPFGIKSIILYYLALVKCSYDFVPDSYLIHACLPDVLQTI